MQNKIIKTIVPSTNAKVVSNKTTGKTPLQHTTEPVPLLCYQVGRIINAGRKSQQGVFILGCNSKEFNEGRYGKESSSPSQTRP